MGGKNKVEGLPPERRTRGGTHGGASFPAAPTQTELPSDYPAVLGQIKQRIQKERLRIVMTANSAMVSLYWDIGRTILEQQGREGWGAKVIDRLSKDLREAYPDMRGLSPRNLKYMRAFAASWPDAEIVQGPLAQMAWLYNNTFEQLHDMECCVGVKVFTHSGPCRSRTMNASHPAGKAFRT